MHDTITAYTVQYAFKLGHFLEHSLQGTIYILQDDQRWKKGMKVQTMFVENCSWSGKYLQSIMPFLLKTVFCGEFVFFFGRSIAFFWRLIFSSSSDCKVKKKINLKKSYDRLHAFVRSN